MFEAGSVTYFLLFSPVFFKKGKTGLCQVLYASDVRQILAILSCLGTRHAILTQVLQISVSADICHTAKLCLAFAAPSLRELCALEFCSLDRPLKKAGHMQGLIAHPPPPSFFSTPLDWLQNI